MTRYIDVTLPIAPGMAVYPGDPPVALAPWATVSAGGFNVSALRLGTHTGTHIDAPAHCFDGAAGVDAISLDVLCGPAFVLDCASVRTPPTPLGPAALVGAPAGCTRLLLRTRGEESANAAGLSLAAADWLITHGVRLVGIDRLSIAPAHDPLPVHQRLLGAGVIILEGLDLADAPAGPCELLCLPLKLHGADGAPARVALIVE